MARKKASTKKSNTRPETPPTEPERYLILAGCARTRKEALQLYQQAIAAAEQAGTKTKDSGPYLRACLGLAHSLWDTGKRDAAIVQAREMLQLWPQDRSGVRFTLAAWLLNLDRDAELIQLLEQFAHEKCASWIYTRALLSFRQQGDVPESQKLLKQACKSNKHVPGYLLREKDPPRSTPIVAAGTTGEALEYVDAFLPAWRNTEGAFDWLRLPTSPKPKKQEQKPEAQGPTPASKNALRKLKQKPESWQVDCRQLPVWLFEGGKSVRPWATLVFDPENGGVVGSDTTAEQPSAAHLWDVLARTAGRPLVGSPGRPSAIHFPSGRPWDELQPHWQEVDVRFEPQAALPGLDDTFPVLVEQMTGEPRPGLLDLPGVTEERARCFFEAAAHYFRHSPWRHVGYESAIEVRCDHSETGPWYAIVIGQSGMTLGLALYNDLDLLRRTWAEDLTDEENAQGIEGACVTFGDQTTLPIADLEAQHKHGWPLARSDAYPSIFYKELGDSLRPVLAWELELMTACLRTIPDFLQRRAQEDSTPEEMTVPNGNGQVTLHLRWIGEEEPPASGVEGRPPAESDDLFDAVLRVLPTIQKAYDDFADKRPVILLDVAEGKIYAYPYEQFKSGLSPTGQKSLALQYEKAKSENQMVVFVRDALNRRMVSYSLDLTLE